MIVAVLSGTMAPVSLIFAVDEKTTGNELRFKKLETEQLERAGQLKNFDSEEKMKTFSVDESLKKLAEMKQSQKQNYVEGEVLVKFKEDRINLEQSSGRRDAMTFATSKSLEKKEDIRKSNISVLKIKDSKTVEEKIAELKNDPDVEYVQPNFLYYPSAIDTNDALRDQLWALENTGQTINGTPYSGGVVTGTPNADIDAPEAWAINEGTNDSVIVAVIDTGVAYNHPDLAGNMWNGNACTGQDINGNPILGSCMHGFDFIDNDLIPLPTTDSHGTHVAGTIGAVKNNNKGIIGVAPNVKIMALKVDLPTGGFPSSAIVAAINFAEQNEAKIINASFGGESEDLAQKNAIASFSGIFVAAAGNGGSDQIGDNNESTHSYPSDYNLDNIISVAATDQNDVLATFSNYGIISVDVGAPGVNILSAIANTNVFSEDFSSVTLPDVGSKFTQIEDEDKTWGTIDTFDFLYPLIYGNAIFSDYQSFLLGEDYQNNIESYLLSDFIDLSGRENIHLKFDYICDIEESWDNLHLFVYDGSDVEHLDTFTGFAFGEADYILSDKYAVNNFSFFFVWQTDSYNDGGPYFGCIVDNFEVVTYSDGFDEKYEYYQGTSMAAPHVAGLAALIWGYDSGLSIEQVKDIIINTGDDLPTGSKEKINGGNGKRINAHEALLSLTDTTIPVVTLIGDNPVDINVGDTYDDDGATATDDIDGDITDNIITVNPVDTSTAGIYTVTYNVSDTAGNPADEVTRTVNISEAPNSPPVMDSITLNPNPAYTNTEITATAVASDSDVGDIITFSYQWKKSFAVGYDFEDMAGETDATLSSDNFVKGNIIKVVVTLNDGTDDGNSMESDPIIISNSVPTQPTVFIEPNPAYANNDLTCIPSGSTDVDAGDNPVSYVYQWYKNGVAEEHSNMVLASHTTAGDTWKCEVVADDGEAQSSVGEDSVEILEVPDTTPPIIDEASPVLTPTNDNTPSYTFTSDETGSIIYYGSCGPCSNVQAIVGENTVTFGPLADGLYDDCTVIVVDASGNPSDALAVSSFTVDTQIPVITLLGVNPTELYVGDTYVEHGATATDNVGITEEIAIDDSNVNTGEAGTYVVTYNVSDNAGNPANEVTRTVNVNEIILESIEITNPATKLVYMVGEELDITGLEITGTYNNGTMQIETITTANIIGFDSSTSVTDQILTITVDEKTTTYTIDIIPVPDTTPPIIVEEVSALTPTNDNTPEYTFSSTEAGDITYGGLCPSATNSVAFIGDNIITFDPLADGLYNDCTIMVTDNSGNDSNILAVSSFTVDTANPTAEETTPITTPTSDTTPDVGITVENGASWEIKNGDDVLKTGVGNGTEQTVALSELGEGTYSLTLIATDEAGNVTTVNLSEFTIDLSVSPINLSTLPNDPTNETDADITVSGDDIVFYKYNLDSTGYGVEISIDTNIVLSGLSEGEHTIFVKGRDGVGNWSDEISETWTVDLTAPNAPVVTDPAEAVILNADTYSITGTAENNSLVEIYSGAELVGSQQLGIGETAYSIEVNLTQNADNNFTATTTDLAGNESANATVPTVTEDSIAPVVIITLPADGWITNQSTITVEYTMDGTFYSDVENLSEEGENIIIRNSVEDAAGNVGSDSITVILDITKPVITILGDNPLNLYVGDTYEELGATAEDNISDAITINSGSVDTSVAGTYEVTYNVSDEAGNEADEAIRIVVVNEDATPPVRSNGLPTGTLVAGTTETTLSLTTDEDATCRYSIAAGIEYDEMTVFNTTNATTHSTLVTGLTSGNNYYIRCQDNYDNSNADDYEISFSVASPPASSGGGGGGGGGYTPPTNISSVNNPLKITSIQQGTLIQNLNNENKVKVEIPKGSIKSTTTFTASEGSLEDGDIPKDKIGAFLFSGLVFNVEAVDANGNAVREFSEDLTITLTIPDLPDDISTLELYYFDDEKEEWTIITDIEFGDGTITFKVNHLTQFAVFETNATKASTLSTPEVKGVTITEIFDGDIIQCQSSDNPFAVYIVKIVGDTKYIRHIVSLEIFNYYGHLRWENLKQVESLSDYSLSGWVRHNTGPNRTAGPTDKVYEINGDQTKHWINMTAEDFLSHGGSEPAIYSVNQGELDLYATGADVMSL